MASANPAPDRRATLVRIAASLLLLFYCYLAIAITLANVAADRLPSLALSLWPSHAEANVQFAEQTAQLNTSGGDNRAGVLAHAREALKTSPASAAALRIIGFQAVAHGNTAAANKLFNVAEDLSRRDLQTQIWQIEQSVQSGDVSSALYHYAAALRVFPQAQTILFPPLANAVSHPELRAPVADLVSSEDSWRNAFLTYLTANAKDAVTSNFFIAMADRHVQLPASLIQILIPRLIQNGDPGGAATLYRYVDPQWSPTSLPAQLDGNFERVGLAPFGWSIADQSAFIGSRTNAASDNALHAALQDGQPVTIARKLLLIGPGRYSITGTYRLTSGGANVMLRLGLACSGAAGATHEVKLDQKRSEFHVELSAPNCPATWLSITAVPIGDNAVSMWIDRLAMRKTSDG